MSALQFILMFVTAPLAVFWEATPSGIRSLLGTQVDLLPPLMVYTALTAGLPAVALMSVWSGLLFDSLSANPLGITVLPLFFVGLVINANRSLILREQVFAQLVLGLAASAITPILTLLLLLTKGAEPMVGWVSLWQWLVMSLGGAAATPIFFALFEWFNRLLGYQPMMQTSFRPDREIRRGRN